MRLVIDMPDLDAWQESAMDELILGVVHVVGQLPGLRYSTGCDLTGVRPFDDDVTREHVGTWSVEL